MVPMNDTLREIALFVLDWYKDYGKENLEPEMLFLDELDMSQPEGRFEVLLLARLFSEYRMKEENAIEIWKEIKSWFHERGYSYQEVFAGENPDGLEQLSNLLVELSFPGDLSRFADQMELLMTRLQTGKIQFAKRGTWAKTVKALEMAFKGTGIRQKAFWVYRVLKQTGEWDDIPGKFCCVSDRHVKAFLRKSGFVSDPEEDLFLNSRIMWRYFNEQFEARYYDLPVFRFSREHGCARCNAAKCSIDRMRRCVEEKRRQSSSVEL